MTDVNCVTSGSVSSSATGTNVGAHDGVGRADDILCAEVDEEDIEPTTGTVLEDDCALTFGTSSRSLNSHKSGDAHRDTKLEANATLLEMESTRSDVYGMAT